MNDKKMKFIQRPAPVFVEHRPIYKIGQILLILYLSSRGFKSSLTRLQLFNWLIKERVRKDKVILSIKNNKLDVYAWGFDPALTIALRYAIAEKLIDENVDSFKLTNKGVEYCVRILEDETLFEEEKTFLQVVKKSITEKIVDSATKGWK
ncbi:MULTISPECIES: hypothetical protein [unclassified Acinetobacter]|uniref:hypothetical protein n=1 Tax=unclassified Acinetobacter TaxID=196816 RepID=UPI000E3500C6|nr:MULTISPECIES: hypothetical protein [unclassified Acinetobacter]RFS31703.1 hypothetical protein DYI81_07510 [Acinetobacter sp. SWAC5]UNT58822.1 hypothetical protein IHE35_12090 [Acinetobacter sp. ASP199]